MEDIIIIECRKFTDQVLNWLNAFYPNNIYYYHVMDNDTSLTLKIRLVMANNLYIKRANGIISYIKRTFRYSPYIKVNYRYNRPFFDLTILCGAINKSIYMSENKK
jgi:hypothetical protein